LNVFKRKFGFQGEQCPLLTILLTSPTSLVCQNLHTHNQYNQHGIEAKNSYATTKPQAASNMRGMPPTKFRKDFNNLPV